MAVEFTPKHNRTSEYRFFPEDIVVKPSLNGRYGVPDIEALIHDILANGQHTPVVIRNDGGKPVLCAGYSRYRAVSEINRRKLLDSPIPLRCTYSQCSEAKGFLVAISENRICNSTTELDDAHNIARLMKVYAKTEDEVAAIYFPGSSKPDKPTPKEHLRWIKKRLALVNLTPAAEKAMREGKLKGSAAVVISKLDQEHQAEALAGMNRHKPKARAAQKPSLKAQIAAALEARQTPDGAMLADAVIDWLRSLIQ